MPMDMAKIYDFITGLCDFSVVFLILFAIGAILFFLKVFKSDFSKPD
jgi:hypothetical protein